MRKADSMGTITAEPLAVPEKKMKRTEDNVLSAESETEMKFCAIRSDEARARRKATKKQHQRARKASIRGIQNMTETDGAQEAEEAE